jgi:hypothetical protein
VGSALVPDVEVGRGVSGDDAAADVDALLPLVAVEVRLQPLNPGGIGRRARRRGLRGRDRRRDGDGDYGERNWTETLI